MESSATITMSISEYDGMMKRMCELEDEVSTLKSLKKDQVIIAKNEISHSSSPAEGLFYDLVTLDDRSFNGGEFIVLHKDELVGRMASLYDNMVRKNKEDNLTRLIEELNRRNDGLGDFISVLERVAPCRGMPSDEQWNELKEIVQKRRDSYNNHFIRYAV
jgi:hypothetical protein